MHKENRFKSKCKIIFENEVEKMPKVSVIVPMYNVEQYVEKCLETLVNQTLKEIEIIVIDDGSSDGTKWVNR